jgi:hypothetical protein
VIKHEGLTVMSKALSTIFNVFKTIFISKTTMRKGESIPAKKYYSPIIDSHTVFDCKRYSYDLDGEIDEALFGNKNKTKDD